LEGADAVTEVDSVDTVDTAASGTVGETVDVKGGSSVGVVAIVVG
jgi:hypothetical protein